MHIGYQVISSPLGELLVAGTQEAITHIRRGNDKAELSSSFLLEHENASTFAKTSYVNRACDAVLQYLEGRSTYIDVMVELRGTEFQCDVWQALLRIPYGKTVSYSKIAETIGMPDAFRAVANACGENPVPIIVPCHRVIHKNGDIRGFGWGVATKRHLLDLEKRHTGKRAHAA